MSGARRSWSRSATRSAKATSAGPHARWTAVPRSAASRSAWAAQEGGSSATRCPWAAARAGSRGERVVRAQREAAHAPAQVPRAQRGVGADDEDRLAGRDEGAQQARDAAAAAVLDRRGRRRRVARSRGRVGRRVGGPAPRRARPGRVRARVIGPGSGAVAQRRTSRGSTAPCQALRSRATTASRTPSGASGSDVRLKATPRARAGPASSVKRRCLPSPIGRGSARRAAGTSSATSGLAVPNGARRPSSSASSSPSSSPATTASTRWTGTRSSGGEHARGVRREGGAERVELGARHRAARGRAVAAVAQEVPGAGVEAAQEVEGRDGAPGARPLVAVEGDQERRAVVALGDA